MAAHREIDIIMIDVDTVTLPFPKEKYEAEAKKLIESFGYEVLGFSYRLSNSKGIHIAVYITPRVEWWEKPFFAYLLGSDPVRECLNYFRLSKGVDISVLFTTKRRVRNNDTDAVLIKGKEGLNSGWFNCLKRWSICKGLKRLVEMAEKNGIYRLDVDRLL
jgi:hypothetical protein